MDAEGAGVQWGRVGAHKEQNVQKGPGREGAGLEGFETVESVASGARGWIQLGWDPEGVQNAVDAEFRRGSWSREGSGAEAVWSTEVWGLEGRDCRWAEPRPWPHHPHAPAGEDSDQGRR